MTQNRLVSLAALAFGATIVLGAFVASRPPTRIDALGAHLRGTALPLALFFTGLGRWYAITAVAALALALAALTRRGVGVVAAIAVSQLIAQGVVEALKILFDRSRPDDWLRIRELGHSYPSGHAVTTIVFYGALLLAAQSSQLPRPAALLACIALGTCIVGIPWSRLALGAHYPTDVAGGLLFGVGWLALLVVLGARAGLLRSA